MLSFFNSPTAKQYSDDATYKSSQEYSKVFYRVGIAENSLVALQVGYNEILMNKQAVSDLIGQLTIFMNQLPDPPKTSNEQPVV